MNANIEKEGIGSWSYLRDQLRKRTTEPFGHASFVIYFLVAVVGAGGAGIWLELNSYFFSSQSSSSDTNLASLRTAVITFFPALAGSACMQIVWAENHKVVRAFSMCALFLITATALIFSQSPAITDCVALTFGTIATVGALWLWWIANANEKAFRDDTDPDTTIGGRIDNDLSGTLNGFET